ncbi:MAG: EAL domain-containing protein [Lachnospiraceae bacterium]|nr:EAL domain-containing protein [Lachnospiraceae bacterium]
MVKSRREVLIVEDQKLNREMLQDILEPNYEIVCADNGLEALNILLEDGEKFSAVLLDILMPVMDGYEVMRVMQKTPHLSTIPVLVTSQAFEEEYELKALNMGASDFISKPYNAEILKKRLHNLIQMHENATAVGVMERDNLTGLYSKEGFCHKMDEVLKTRPDILFDVIALDIEHFKLFNDTYGVDEGDQLLKFVARRIVDESDECNGICARVYADQFLIFCERGEDYALKMVDNINRHMEDYPLDMKVHVKIGVYQIHDITVAVNSMCDRAFIAVKAAKGRYENDVAYYDDSIREKLLREQQIGDDMVHALKEEQFEVYFQPKYNLVTGKMTGAEALVRWHHPIKGFMSPAEFIPIFEKNGFITELDMYVWHKSCEHIAKWREKYGRWVSLSVNVSRKDIYKQNLPDILRGMVERYGIPPEILHLEITESAYTENPEQLILIVQQLKKEGFIIEMDDFGSGYSSLNMLAELPIDILKLDMKFLQNKGEQSKNENIMSAIVELAKKINLYVIAEGVEKEKQISMLKSMKCDMVQGYYYAKPMPAEEFEKTCLD